MIRTVRNYLSSISNASVFPAGSTVFSLIQPTGKIHLGNYLGALSNWRDISNDERNSESLFIFGTADLHALTSVTDPVKLKNSRREAIASLIASGINPERSIIYHQSSIAEHSQLSWILTCLTSMGALNRMTQWKLKAKVEESESIFGDEILGKTKAGVLCYPVLQAADILLYRSTHVPVGDDQAQHLELCRNIASIFNSTYNTDFLPLPKSLFTANKKIMSLRSSERKMSKSDVDQNGCLYITESPDQIAKKLRKATTDSIQGRLYFDPIERPGVSNLINIVAGLTRKSVEETVKDLEYIENHKQLKDLVTDLIVEEFKDQRIMYEELMKDVAYIDQIANKGAEKAKNIASTNMREIERLVGLD